LQLKDKKVLEHDKSLNRNGANCTKLFFAKAARYNALAIQNAGYKTLDHELRRTCYKSTM
jgi:hypothetical protein